MRYLPFLSKIFIIYNCEVTDVRFMLLRALEKNAVPILLNDRKMNFNDLTFVRSGELSYIINEKSFTVKAGEAMYCPTGARRYRFKGTQSADYFSVNFKCAPEEKLDLPYHIKDALTPEIEEYFKNIMKLVDRTGEYDKFKCDAYTSLIAYATLERKPESIENRYLTGMKSYISENWNKKISIGDVTSAAGLSRSYGAAFFKEHTGMPVMNYIIRVRIGKACEMLKYSDDMIYEIAENTGFKDLYYFSNMFKKIVGMSPKKYREIESNMLDNAERNFELYSGDMYD